VIEFTGERVIPGEVNDDLWAEHAARYAFALRYAHHSRALDLGCGSGYGVAEIAKRARFAVGIDSSHEAVAYAQAHYQRANVRFLQASATSLPFADRSFELITAFEVIEHLAEWPDLVKEAARVLQAHGVFLVSTPNKLYYTQSRGEHGPNPFHVHEFEFEEFRDVLARSFPNVVIFLQNRQESFTFAPAAADASGPEAHLPLAALRADEANFFVAVCSAAPPGDARPFVYVPRAANLLREREQHIALLQSELAQTKKWLDELIADHKALQDAHLEQTHHLEEQNRWALDLEAKWRSAMDRVTALQDELKSEQANAARIVDQYNAKISELEQENRARAQWAIDTETRLSAGLAAKSAELSEAVRLLDRAEATVIERTEWAQNLQKRIDFLETQLAMVRQSRWVRLGRIAGVGPRVKE
jgi:SAM-dependent methyltransferase